MMQEVPPLENLKKYIRFGYSDLRSRLSVCHTNDDVLELITDICSLVDIEPLNAVINKFNIKEAKPIIEQYKQDVDKFCEELPLSLSLNQFISTPPQLLAETIYFEVNQDVKDQTIKDVRDLIEKAFGKHSKVKITVVKKSNSFTITCSFPLTLFLALIASAHKNQELLIAEGVYYLTIGYCTVLDIGKTPNQV